VVGSPEEQDVEEFVEDEPIGDAGMVAAQRVGSNAEN
jgi:hypothetical protein